MAALRSLSSSEPDYSPPRLGRRGGPSKQRASTHMRAHGRTLGHMAAAFSSSCLRGIAWLTEPFRAPARRQILLDMPLRYKCSLRGEFGSVMEEAGANGEPPPPADSGSAPQPLRKRYSGGRPWASWHLIYNLDGSFRGYEWALDEYGNPIPSRVYEQENRNPDGSPRMVAPERTNQTWPQTLADGMDSGATIRRTDPWGPDKPWPSWST